MAQVVNAVNRMLRGPGGMMSVQHDDNLTGAGTNASLLGLNDPISLSATSATDQGTFKHSFGHSADVLEIQSDTGYSTSYNYKRSVSATPYGIDAQSEFSYVDQDTGSYSRGSVSPYSIAVVGGEISGGVYSATQGVTAGYQGLTSFNKNTSASAELYPYGVYIQYRSGDTTALGYLGNSNFTLYSANYYAHNSVRTDIKAGAEAQTVTYVPESSQWSAVYRNSGAGIKVWSYEPGTINSPNGGLFIDTAGFEYHDHSLTRYTTFGDLWGSGKWYKNSWSLFNPSRNGYDCFIDAKPPNYHDQYGDNYWITMKRQDWSYINDGLERSAMRSENSAQYTIDNVRYVHDTGYSATIGIDGITLCKNGTSITLDYDKLAALLAMVN